MNFCHENCLVKIPGGGGVLAVYMMGGPMYVFGWKICILCIFLGQRSGFFLSIFKQIRNISVFMNLFSAPWELNEFRKKMLILRRQYNGCICEFFIVVYFSILLYDSLQCCPSMSFMSLQLHPGNCSSAGFIITCMCKIMH